MWKPIEIKPGDQSLVGRKIKATFWGQNTESIITAITAISLIFLNPEDKTSELKYSIKDHKWLIWEEPKRWRALESELYYYLTEYLDIQETYDCDAEADESRFSVYNYFKTPEQAQRFAGECRKLAERLHESFGE